MNVKRMMQKRYRKAYECERIHKIFLNNCMERRPKDVSDREFSKNSISNIYKWAHL